MQGVEDPEMFKYLRCHSPLVLFDSFTPSRLCSLSLCVCVASFALFSRSFPVSLLQKCFFLPVVMLACASLSADALRVGEACLPPSISVSCFLYGLHATISHVMSTFSPNIAFVFEGLNMTFGRCRIPGTQFVPRP